MKKVFYMIACLVLCVCVLAGCGEETPVPTTQATVSTQAPLREYQVTFRVLEQDVLTASVTEGECACAPLSGMPGWILSGWVDETGAEVDPETKKVSADCVYTAVLYPDLTSHNAYLFADEHGMIRGKDGITEGELKQALLSLAVRQETVTRLHLPESDNALTPEMLKTALCGCFPAETVERVMGALSGETVTREDFARIMNILLGRGNEEAVSLTAGVDLPRDMDLNSDGHLLEAVVAHAPAEDGSLLFDAVLAGTWQPGFTNVNGWLYYADESGSLLRDGSLGTLTFGADGRFTSGDEELDTIVAGKLLEFASADPAQSREELLYTAFIHCRDGYRYVGRGLLEAGETGWGVEWAKEMFTKGAGNCYSYAAIFWALARGLGYDAECISGHTTVDYEPHGWVEFELDGERFVFDPELAMAYLRDGKQYEAMYKMPMWMAEQWPYHWPS